LPRNWKNIGFLLFLLANAKGRSYNRIPVVQCYSLQITKTRNINNMADKPLTKSQIATAVAEANDLTKKQAADLLANLAELAISSTKATGAFTFPGIGKLKLVDRKARMGRNPATGESIKIPAKRVVKFAVAKAAKDSIAS